MAKSTSRKKAPTPAATPAAAAAATAAASTVPGPRIQVQATQLGYYDHQRRRDGDVFWIRAPDFTATWMARTDGRAVERATGAQAALDQAHDAIVGGKVARPAADGGATGDADPLGD